MSEAETDVVVGIAGHVETVRVVERLGISIGGVLHQVHHVAGRQGLALHLHRVDQGADLHFRRSVKPQDLLDRRLDQRKGELVCFLASREAGFINGAYILIDGGSLAWRGTVDQLGME